MCWVSVLRGRVVLWCVLCSVAGWRTPACGSKTPPCAHSKRLRVCWQHSPHALSIWTCCRQTRKYFPGTHEGVALPEWWMGEKGRKKEPKPITLFRENKVVTRTRGSPKVTNGSYPSGVRKQLENNALQIPLIIRASC